MHRKARIATRFGMTPPFLGDSIPFAESVRGTARAGRKEKGRRRPLATAPLKRSLLTSFELLVAAQLLRLRAGGRDGARAGVLDRAVVHRNLDLVVHEAAEIRADVIREGVAAVVAGRRHEVGDAGVRAGRGGGAGDVVTLHAALGAGLPVDVDGATARIASREGDDARRGARAIDALAVRADEPARAGAAGLDGRRAVARALHADRQGEPGGGPRCNRDAGTGGA